MWGETAVPQQPMFKGQAKMTNIIQIEDYQSLPCMSLYRIKMSNNTKVNHTDTGKQ